MNLRRHTHLRLTALTVPVLVLLFLLSCAPKVEDLGIFAESRLQDVLGQDGVTSIPLSEKYTLWTFGDTILGSWKKDADPKAPFGERITMTAMLPNSLAYTRGMTAENLPNLKFTYHKEEGKVASFIKYKKGENPFRQRLWAFDGIRLGNRVYVYYGDIAIDDPTKALSFRMAGIGLARWDIPKNWTPEQGVNFVRLGHIFDGDGASFGSCVIERGGYLYLIGQYSTPDKKAPVKIARVLKEEVENGKAYRFLTADGRWVKNVEEAHPYLNDVAGECSLTYNEHLEKYIITYCQLPEGKIVVVPFKNFRDLKDASKEVLYTPPTLPPATGNQTPWYYSGKEVVNFGKTAYAIYINPIEYQPYLLKVTY